MIQEPRDDEDEITVAKSIFDELTDDSDADVSDEDEDDDTSDC